VSSVAEFLSSPGARRISVEEERPARVFSKVEVHRTLSSIEADWAELENCAPASVYQTRAFLRPWIETLGVARQIEPLFIVAKDAHGKTVALLCLGLQRRAWFRVAMFLGGKESNFNLGLFRPGARFRAADLRALLRQAAKAMGPDAPDIFILKNQPHQWSAWHNPFALMPHRRSASFAYATGLDADATAFLTSKLSKDTRKKLRKKEARLAEIGSLAVTTGDTSDERRQILDTFFIDKIRRCEEKGMTSDFAAAAMRKFFDRLSDQKTAAGHAWFELFGLMLDGRVIATYAGAAHRDRFSAMVNSFDNEGTIAKSSPGDLLLMKLIAAQCAKGRLSFDLGIGEARYKMTYCDTTVPLFDVVMPVSGAGYILAVRQAVCSRLKLAIKQRPKTFALFRQLKYFAEHDCHVDPRLALRRLFTLQKIEAPVAKSSF
jgi:CelD/BcsL family acetyltransferase involved in cellulose biosynthesis